MLWVCRVGVDNYLVVDELTLSHSIITRRGIKELYKSGLEFANIEFKKGELILDSVYRKMRDKNILVLNKVGDMYTIFSTSLFVGLRINKVEIDRFIEQERIINYIEEEIIDIREIERDIEFESSIKKEIDKFKSKFGLLGIKLDMAYEILGRDVVLTRYKCDKLIKIPDCVTALGSKSIESKAKEVKLGNNIRAIGCRALWNTNVAEIKIPDSVEYTYGNILNKLVEVGNISYSNNKTIVIKGGFVR